MASEHPGAPTLEDIVWPSDDHAAVYTYRGCLPHWRLKGAICYVTFRLADSIPRLIAQQWAADRRTWLIDRGITPGLPEDEQQRRYLAIPPRERRAFERDMTRKFFVELDRCHGACILRNPEAAQIVAGALRFYDGVRLRCLDFVVMPNHVHWLLIPLGDHEPEAILRSVKGWTSNRINKLVGRTGRLWQKESFDHLVRNPDELERIRRYIEDNPAKAHLKLSECLHYRADWP